VDLAQRRQQIFDAFFDVVVDNGVEQASLARVAEAAGLSIGSVRHYAGSQGELTSDAATEIVDRISARLQRHLDQPARRTTGSSGDGGASLAEEVLCELLPLDERRLRETTVWLEFSLAARTHEELREPADRLFAGSRALARTVIERGKGLVPEADVDVEAERLAALIDGLALHGVLAPDTLTAETARAAVRRHLEQLRKSAGRRGG
jgi:AcrR family transcriptional regulator